MLHMLLTMLKIIGIILAGILGLILLLLLIVLFVPIRYRIRGAKTEETMDGKACVSWLFGAVGVYFFLKNKDFSYEIRIFGIPLERIQAFIRKFTFKKSTGKEITKMELEKEHLESVKTNITKLDVEIPKADNAIDVKQIEEQQTERKVRSVASSIWSFPGKAAERVRKIRLTLASVCDKSKYWINFLKEETTKEAISLVKIQLMKVLKHILPQKLKGNVIFGFEDPATTGQVLGGICAFYPLYYKQINISPDFTQNILLGDIDMKGRIYICFLGGTALNVYFNKNIQHILKTMKNRRLQDGE